MKKVTVVQDEKDVVPIEILATSIRAIAASVKALRAGPLGESALLLLISKNCRSKRKYGGSAKADVSITTVKMVLDSMESLQTTYLK